VLLKDGQTPDAQKARQGLTDGVPEYNLLNIKNITEFREREESL
jgi:hypothetical protein